MVDMEVKEPVFDHEKLGQDKKVVGKLENDKIEDETKVQLKDAVQLEQHKNEEQTIE